jgi:hypothetical protein
MATSRELIADARLIDVGWSVWSATRTVAVTGDRDPEPLGGVVCAMESAEDKDLETGEVVTVTLYRVRDPYRAGDRCQWLRSTEIELPDGIEPPESNRLYRMVRRLCLGIGVTTTRDGKRKGSVWLTATEAEALADAYHLLAKAISR